MATWCLSPLGVTCKLMVRTRKNKENSNYIVKGNKTQAPVSMVYCATEKEQLNKAWLSCRKLVELRSTRGCSCSSVFDMRLTALERIYTNLLTSCEFATPNGRKNWKISWNMPFLLKAHGKPLTSVKCHYFISTVIIKISDFKSPCRASACSYQKYL